MPNSSGVSLATVGDHNVLQYAMLNIMRPYVPQRSGTRGQDVRKAACAIRKFMENRQVTLGGRTVVFSFRAQGHYLARVHNYLMPSAGADYLDYYMREDTARDLTAAEKAHLPSCK